MKFNIKNITDNDIEKIMRYNATFGKFINMMDLAEKLKPRFDCNDEVWQKMCMILYAYKLGEMQGKREERLKRKGKSYIAGGVD
ncbi:hypothetical protein FDF11_01755 [Clostridium botulinum]|nr:hypothetical protein [Clostridium botulinum]NFR13885.1 hypothetical protein [Clostridium botulinum]NFR42526.1 hypothetical protein [Clostridium botulinum]NFS49426.1 hypothetical protein [Clostridium botulinum]